MDALLDRICKRLIPAYTGLNDADQLQQRGDLFGLLWALPFAVAGVIWAIAVTDTQVLASAWPWLLGMALVVWLFDERWNFVLYLDEKLQTSASASLAPTVVWTALLIFGPTAVWIQLPSLIYSFVQNWRRSSVPRVRMENIRNATQTLGVDTFVQLASITAYLQLGGVIPMPGLQPAYVLAALTGIAVSAVIFTLIFFPFMQYWLSHAEQMPILGSVRQVRRNFAVVIGLSMFGSIFGILGAAVYAQMGIAGFLFGLVALITVSVLAKRLSDSVQVGARRARALQQLEAMGRAIAASPADMAQLPSLLQTHGQLLFADGRYEAVLFPDTLLIHERDGWPRVDAAVWSQLQTSSQPHIMLDGMILPGDRAVKRAALAVPVIDDDTGERIGGIYVLRNAAAGKVDEFLPIAQTLAAQIASAITRVRSHQKELARQRTEQELEFAAKVQAGFLPAASPVAAGWQFAAQLQSAKETSGDFFDFVELPDNRMGLVIADVADKGVGAALVMALCRTLIRSYARAHPHAPERVLHEVNERMCEEARTEIFVTVLYGVLDLQTGRFMYANAGHLPPVLIQKGVVHTNEPGCLPLGLFPNLPAVCEEIQLQPEDTLVLYTDGMLDAQNEAGEFFGEARFKQALQTQAGLSAREIRNGMIDLITRHAEGANVFDDLTLIVVRREAGPA
jgi:serine phosphatase RsbU (regulator of sigma subunit)